VISLDDSPMGTMTTTSSQMPVECRYPGWQQSRRPADAGLRNCVFLCSIAAICSSAMFLLLRAKRYAAVTAMPDAAAS
jgi:hypothetical protein